MRLAAKKMSAGFTLIEILVVISIMVILTSAVLANFSGLSQKRNVISGRDTLMANFRRMQSSALASKDALNGSPSSSYGAIINLNTPTTYTLFVEDNGNPTNRTTLDTITLPSRTSFTGIRVVNSTNQSFNPTSITVYFTVPYGRTLQTYGAFTKEKDDTTTITITSQDGTTAKTVVVNGVSGNISAP